MEASTVYYTDFRCPVGTSLTEKLRRLCIAAGIKTMDLDGKFVAIKMHFGELGNLAFLRPNYAKVVADLCKEQGGMPFLTDCNTLYPGSRKNALEHLTCAQLNGFWPMTTGCQILIGDGLRGTDEVEVPVPNGEYCKTAKIGRAIMDADVFISLTHFKGHEATGFGGAIKNIGMGCGSRAGKMEQHAAGKPAVQEGLCRGCHRCAKECGSDAITYNAENKAVIDYDKCKGCGRCIGACSFDAIYSPNDCANELLDRKMAEYAAAVCYDRPCFHISLVQDISPNCDCHGENDAPILPDIGMFASFDPVALDQACADACLNAQPKPCKAGLELPPRQLQGFQPQHRVESHPRTGREGRHGHPAVCAEESLNKKTARAAHELFFCLLNFRRQGVHHVPQGVPVVLGEVGQIGGVKACILDAAADAVVLGKDVLRRFPDHGPCLGKAVFVQTVQCVVPLVERVLNGGGGAVGHPGFVRPAHQGSCGQHRFQRAARNTGPPAQAGLKGGGGVGSVEQGVLVEAGPQVSGVGLRGAGRDALAGSAGRACRAVCGAAAGSAAGQQADGEHSRQQQGE